jgi:uncharacterized protein
MRPRCGFGGCRPTRATPPPSRISGLCTSKARACRRILLRLWRGLARLPTTGNAGAEYNLGVIYGNGLGVKQDYVAALTWFRKASDQGDAKAQYALGTMYFEGKGVRQDFKAAAALLRKAADQGLSDAQYALGTTYFEGKGVRQDFKAAAALLRKAADQGYAAAQNNLETMYENGVGVTRDYVQAHMWFDLAAQRFLAPHSLPAQRFLASDAELHNLAVKNGNRVAAKMTPAQIAEAQKFAREWKPAPPK